MNRLNVFHTFKETFEFYKNLNNYTDKVFKIKLIPNSAKFKKNKIKKLFMLAIIITNLIFVSFIPVATANENIIVGLAQFSLQCYPKALFGDYNDKITFGNAVKNYFRTDIEWKVVPYFKFRYADNVDNMSNVNNYICNYLANDLFRQYPRLDEFGAMSFVCNKNVTFNQLSDIILEGYTKSNNTHILYPVKEQKIVYKKSGLIILGCGEFIGKGPDNNKKGKYKIYMTTYWTDFNRPKLINIIGATFNNKLINLSNFLSDVYYN